MALTRTTDQKEQLSLPMPPTEAFAAVKAAYNKVGKIQSVQEKFRRITGSIGSGVWNMNKADVTVQIESDGDSASKIIIIASTQEGLISQNTAGKAISRLLEAI